MITNVYQRKDGRFEGRITVGRIGGKRQYKAFFGRTPDDVITKMTDYRERIVETAAVCKTFSDVFDEWFQSISIRVKDSTLANYVLKAEKHILPVYANDNITDIKQSNISIYQKEAGQRLIEPLYFGYSGTNEIGIQICRSHLPHF